VYFAFKPENFSKLMVPLLIVKKGFVLLVTICFVKKNVLEMKYQLILLCKGQASFFL